MTAATVNARRAAASAVVSVATSSATVVKEEVTAAEDPSVAHVATRTTHVAVGAVTIVDHADTIDAATAVATRLRAVRAAVIVDATMIDAVGVQETLEVAHLPIESSAAPARETSVAHTAKEADHLPIASSAAPAREMSVAHTAREADHLPTVSSAAQARETSVGRTAKEADHRLIDEVDLAASHALATDLEVLVACSKEDQEAMSVPIAVAHTAEGALPT